MDFLLQLYGLYVGYELKGKRRRKLLNYMEFQEKLYQLLIQDDGSYLYKDWKSVDNSKKA
jgi:hypothetical protein